MINQIYLQVHLNYIFTILLVSDNEIKPLLITVFFFLEKNVIFLNGENKPDSFTITFTVTHGMNFVPLKKACFS